MGYSRRTSNYLERIAQFDLTHIKSMVDLVAIVVEILTKHFRVSLIHKNVGQTKFIKTKLTEIRYKIK